MYKFIIKRILFLIPTIIGVTFIIYAVMNITPGDPGRAILGTGVSQADIDAYNHALGYDLPFLQKFGLYIKRMVIDQDFGISYVTKQNAFHEIWPRFLVTLKLSFLGVFLSAIIGIPLGIQAAVKQYKLADTIPSLLAFLLAAVPTFVLGLAMLFLFCDRLNWLPSYGIDTFKHYIMPALAISLPPAAQNFRFTKSSMLEAIRQDYVRTARAKGLSEHTVIYKHAFRNTLIPLVTIIGGSLPGLFSGALITETLFAIPGIGYTSYQAMVGGDIPFSMFYLVFLSVLTLLGNLISDILYAVVDPRVRIA